MYTGGLKVLVSLGGKLTAEPVSADECPTRKPLGTGYTSVGAIQQQDRFLHATSAARILPPFFDVGSGRQRDAGSNAERCCNGDTFHQAPHTDSTSSEIQQEAEARKLCLALQCLKPPAHPHPVPTLTPPRVFFLRRKTDKQIQTRTYSSSGNHNLHSPNHTV